MDNETIISLTSVLVVFAAIAQIAILIIQNRQARLQLVNDFRERWNSCHKNWAQLIFIGRNSGDYYQVTDRKTITELIEITHSEELSYPTIWARDSVRIVCGLLNEASLRILQGQLHVSEVYPIFGTELLRHSNPLRKLLDTYYIDLFVSPESDKNHMMIRTEVQDWLIYHDGIRRRCLILLDLLWAEAVRLEDLPPDDIRSAADSKCKTGKLNRRRIFKEANRLNGLTKITLAIKLSRFLRYAEFRSIFNRNGISKRRLKKLNESWTKRLLENHDLNNNNVD